MDNKGIFSSFTPPGTNNNKKANNESGITEKIMYGLLMIVWGLFVGGISWFLLRVPIGDVLAFLVGAIIGPICAHIKGSRDDERMKNEKEMYENLSPEEQREYKITKFRMELMEVYERKKKNIENGDFDRAIQCDADISYIESRLRELGA